MMVSSGLYVKNKIVLILIFSCLDDGIRINLVSSTHKIQKVSEKITNILRSQSKSGNENHVYLKQEDAQNLSEIQKKLAECICDIQKLKQDIKKQNSEGCNNRADLKYLVRNLNINFKKHFLLNDIFYFNLLQKAEFFRLLNVTKLNVKSNNELYQNFIMLQQEWEEDELD